MVIQASNHSKKYVHESTLFNGILKGVWTGSAQNYKRSNQVIMTLTNAFELL